VIAHAKAAKDATRNLLFGMGLKVVGDGRGAQAFSERPPYLGFGCVGRTLAGGRRALGFDPVCVGL